MTLGDINTHYLNMESYPYLIKTTGDLGWGRRRSVEKLKRITAKKTWFSVG